MEFVALAGPIIGAIIVVFGWSRLNNDASKRDLENWRRTTLANAVTEMIADAEELLHRPVNNDDPEAITKRRLGVSSLEQKKSLVLMCDSGIIWECAHSYIASVRKLMIAKNAPDADSNYKQIADLNDETNRMRSYLVQQLPISIKLQKPMPYDPTYAAVIRSERLSDKQIRWRKLVRKMANAVKTSKHRRPWTKQDEYKEKVLQ